MDSCTQLHEVLQQAHKPGFVHLYDAIKMLEHKYEASEEILNAQLRSMESDGEWQDYFPNPEENLFEAVPCRRPDRVGTMDTTASQPGESKAPELTSNNIFAGLV